MQARTIRVRKRTWGLTVLGMAMALMLSMVASAVGSSHREAPFIAGDPRADNTDVYAFVSPDAPNTVTVVANYIPLQEPAGGPNFYNFSDDVNYVIEFDNNGDGVEDIKYEFRFTTTVVDPSTFLYVTSPVTFAGGQYQGLNVRQTYSITEVRDGQRRTIANNLVVPPNNVGPRSTPNYESLAEEGIHQVQMRPGVRMRVFAGQRDEAFPVDLGSIFDLGGLRPFNAAHIIPLPVEDGVNTTTGFNVHSIVIQVPKSQLVAGGDPVLGIYANSERRQVQVFDPVSLDVETSGPWTQISRLGHPLINEVVIALADKDRFNRSEPADDAQFLEYVTNPILGEVIPAIYPVFTCFPEPPRNDLVTIYLTGIPGLNQPQNVQPAELLRLNTSIAPTPFDEQDPLGLLAGQLDGFPNGRRLVDDVVDISLQAIAGATPLGDCEGESPNNQLGDGVVGNDMPYLESFPYMPTPHEGYSHEHDHS